MGIRQSERLVTTEAITNRAGWVTGGESLMFVDGPGLVMEITWQNGVIGEDGQNGAFVEDVMEAARQRLMIFQANENSRCRENAIALTHLETALAWLDFRTRTRLVQNVENKYEGHQS